MYVYVHALALLEESSFQSHREILNILTFPPTTEKSLTCQDNNLQLLAHA